MSPRYGKKEEKNGVTMYAFTLTISRHCCLIVVARSRFHRSTEIKTSEYTYVRVRMKKEMRKRQTKKIVEKRQTKEKKKATGKKKKRAGHKKKKTEDARQRPSRHHLTRSDSTFFFFCCFFSRKSITCLRQRRCNMLKLSSMCKTFSIFCCVR
jgi:hypothetical protein